VEVFFPESKPFWEVGKEPDSTTSRLFIVSPHNVFGLLGCPTLHPVCDPAELADVQLADVFVVDCRVGEARWWEDWYGQGFSFLASLQVSEFLFEDWRILCAFCVCVILSYFLFEFECRF
jgi:hypothetical protein